MKKLLFILLCFLPTTVVAQTTAHQIYNCYVQRDMQTWKKIIDKLETIAQPTVEQRLEVLNYEYGYIAWRLSKDYKNKEEADQYLAKAYQNLRSLPQEAQYKALVAAYEGAFIGYQIAISPVKAPFIGMKSLKYVKEAVQADSVNYFAHIQYGNVMYYIPGMFGGSRTKAIEHYNKAKKIMQGQGVHQNNWLYMNLLLTLADAYKKDNNWQQVKACYDEALRLQPHYPYITEQLYPTLQKNLEK